MKQLPKELNDDILIYSQTKYYQELSDVEKKKVTKKLYLDFSVCSNRSLANEVKQYIFDKLENKEASLATLSSRNGQFQKILSILNSFDETSFNEMKYEEGKAKFKKECIRLGINTSRKKTLYKGTESETEKQQESKIVQLFGYILNHHKELKYKKYDFNHDVWLLETLPFKIDGWRKSESLNSLNFETFRNDELKTITKKYILQMLNNRKIKTIMTHLSVLKHFDDFLFNKRILECIQINDEVIEKYLSVVRNSDYSEEGKKGHLNIMKTFLFYCRHNNWLSLNEKDLLSLDFSYKALKLNPKYIDDDVMNQIITHMGKMDDLTMDLTFLLMNTGMRISEAVELPMGSLKKDSEGDYFLTYYQFKVEEENSIPIKQELANVILKRELMTKKEFGENAKYVFGKNTDEPIGSRYYSNKLRNFCRTHNIKNKFGDVVTISPHMFRATLVTNYVNNGMKPDLIRKLIGHSSYDTINHYMEIHNTTLRKEMDSILDFQNEMILHIGKELKPKNQEVLEGIPLPNGTCMKPLSEGDCSHINKCLTCAMFKPSLDDLDVFKKQLEEVEKNLVVCKQKGFQRMIEKNEEMRLNIINIIKKLEGESHVR